jgi:aminoglycoside 6'-N-acetyltransferase
VKIPLLKEDDVWALDIFIGDPEQWGKGIASKALKMMVDHLFKERNAKKIIIDPDVRNERAIRAYEKAGFKKQEILHNWEKHNNKWTDAWLMICERKPHT